MKRPMPKIMITIFPEYDRDKHGDLLALVVGLLYARSTQNDILYEMHYNVLNDKIIHYRAIEKLNVLAKCIDKISNGTKEFKYSPPLTYGSGFNIRPLPPQAGA